LGAGHSQQSVGEYSIPETEKMTTHLPLPAVEFPPHAHHAHVDEGSGNDQASSKVEAVDR
jgi:hypothetical protein